MKKKNFIVLPTKKEIDIEQEKKVIDNIRKRRREECFPYINRGRLWYNKLSDYQLLELSRWYQAWLDATKTKKIPSKPEWLDSKLNEEDIL